MGDTGIHWSMIAGAVGALWSIYKYLDSKIERLRRDMESNAGVTGRAGAEGATGRAGAEGIQGKTGATGAKGEKGDG